MSNQPPVEAAIDGADFFIGIVAARYNGEQVDELLASVTEVLLAKGANVNARDKDGLMPLTLVADSGLAAMAEILLAHGADVNAKDNDGRTPLHVAAWMGRTEVAELLLAHYANVNAKNNDDRTPLRFAADSSHDPDANHRAVIELLRQHGGK